MCGKSPLVFGLEPNIPGEFSTRRNIIGPSGANGAYSHGTDENVALEPVGVSSTVSLRGASVFSFSAQKANSIFGASSTVQPSAMRTLVLVRAY